MAFDLGNNFALRWKNTPTSIRTAIFKELNEITQLLETHLTFNQWHTSLNMVVDITPSQDKLADNVLSNTLNHVLNMPSQTTAIHTAETATTEIMTDTVGTVTSAQALEIKLEAIKQQFLQDTDKLVEDALIPIKAKLKQWLYNQLDEHLNSQINDISNYMTQDLP